MYDRDGLDATVNYGVHSKFVEKWLDRLDAEDKATETTVPAATATAEAPQAAAAPNQWFRLENLWEDEKDY